MTTDTKIDNLIINKLTQEQFDSATKSQTELYMVTDADYCYFPNILEHKWSDHLLDDQSWLGADTFSWQSGNTYSTAYNHLKNDFLTATTRITKGIAGIQITYRVATDGHLICLYDQESAVEAIYQATGVSWFYIVDNINNRFKLPRTSNHGTIVEKGQDDSSWYRVYADGWVEQGGYLQEGATSQTVNLLKPMNSTDYVITTGASYTTASALLYSPAVAFTKTTSSFSVYMQNTSYSCYWKVSGYGVNIPEDSEHKYLYFYVGEYSRSAISQTAGLNAELFNGKADRDLSNTIPNDSFKSLAVTWGMPDMSTGVDITTGHITSYNCWCKVFSAVNSCRVSVDGVEVIHPTTQYDGNPGGLFPVKRGAVITFSNTSSVIIYKAIGG